MAIQAETWAGSQAAVIANLTPKISKHHQVTSWAEVLMEGRNNWKKSLYKLVQALFNITEFKFINDTLLCGPEFDKHPLSQDITTAYEAAPTS